MTIPFNNVLIGGEPCEMPELKENVKNKLSELGEYVFNDSDGKALNPNRERRPPTKIDYYTYYDGEWIIGTDIREGKAKMIIYGDLYEGWFNNNNKAIRGRIIYSWGNYYDGEWDNDKRNGKGKFKSFDGRWLYTGDYKDGNYHGYGVY